MEMQWKPPVRLQLNCRGGPGDALTSQPTSLCQQVLRVPLPPFQVFVRRRFTRPVTEHLISCLLADFHLQRLHSN